MLRFLRNNNLISIILIPIFAILLWWQSLANLQPISVKNTMPLFEILWQMLGNNLFLKTLFALLLMLFEAFYLNLFLDKNNLLPRKTFLPAFIFMLLVSSFSDMQMLSPILCGLLFVMFAVSKLAKTYRQESASSYIFDASFYIAVGSLFYFPIIVLFPLVWVSLIVIRPFVWREWAVSILGFCLPYLFTFSAYFWYNRVNFFVFDKIVFPASFNLSSFFLLGIIFKISFFIVLSLIIIGLVKSVIKVPVNTIFARNIAILFIWFFVLSVAMFFLSPNASILYLMICFLPATFYLSSLIIDIKRNWIGEVLLFCLIIIAFSNNYLHTKL